MKVFFTLMFLLTMGIAVYADEVVLSASEDVCPEWVTSTNQWTMATNKKVVSVYYKVAGTGENLDSAKMTANMEANSQLAQHIKSIVHYEFTIHLELVDGEFEPYIKSTMVSLSKNIDTSGKMPAASYWELVQDAQSKEKYYIYYRLYSIEYKQLKKSMIEAWSKELDSMDLSIKKKAKEILKKLKEGK